MDLKAVVVASVQGTDLNLHELLNNLKVKGRLGPLLTEAIVDKIIAHAIQQERIEVDTQELQKAADAFRIRKGLHKSADLKRWLTHNHLAAEEFETELERPLLTEKLAHKVAPADAVAKHFAANRGHFDRARLAHLVVEKEGLAKELMSQLQDDGADFAALARQHSLDEQTKSSGGQLGIVPRNRLDPATAAAAFNAKKGAVVGPFKSERGYQVLKVEDLLLGQLDPETAAAIRRLLFRQWVGEKARAAQVEVKLLRDL
jgi:parvulin-like peptidyl-prolyl isomerase